MDTTAEVLEERMKTMQAEYKTDMAELAKQLAESEARAARRDTWMILTIVGLFVAATTILGTLIRWPV